MSGDVIGLAWEMADEYADHHGTRRTVGSMEPIVTEALRLLLDNPDSTMSDLEAALAGRGEDDPREER